MILITGIMPPPEDEHDDFHKMQESMDRNQWVGRHTLEEFKAGGGNADGDFDADPIEREHAHGYEGIAGPKSALDKGNK